jgi:hypothetical protein
METFVVRVWTAAAGLSDPDDTDLHGVVERVADGHRTIFSSGADLLEILGRQSREGSVERRPAPKRWRR